MIPEDIDWTRLGLGVILGYAISWVYFFLTLPIFMKLLGKINGTVINYGISWLVWIVATYYTHSTNTDDDDSNF
jgi:hypothetical protein